MRYTGELSVDINGMPLTIAYSDTAGDPNATPVLYVPGWGCSKEDFGGAEVDDRLARRRLVAFDFPGCGDSPLPVRELSNHDMVMTARAVTERLRLDTSVVVGHSYGGAIATEYAASFPDRTKGLVSVMGNMALSDCFLTGKVAAMPVEHFVQEGFQAMVLEWATSENSGLQRYAEAIGRYTAAQVRQYHAYAREAVEHTTYGQLLQQFVTWPGQKLFVHGEHERAAYLEQFKRVGMRVATIEGAGHFPFVDAPAAYYKVIGDFVTQLDDVT